MKILLKLEKIEYSDQKIKNFEEMASDDYHYEIKYSIKSVKNYNQRNTKSIKKKCVQRRIKF